MCLAFDFARLAVPPLHDDGPETLAPSTSGPCVVGLDGCPHSAETDAGISRRRCRDGRNAHMATGLTLILPVRLPP